MKSILEAKTIENKGLKLVKEATAASSDLRSTSFLIDKKGDKILKTIKQLQTIS